MVAFELIGQFIVAKVLGRPFSQSGRLEMWLGAAFAVGVLFLAVFIVRLY